MGKIRTLVWINQPKELGEGFSLLSIATVTEETAMDRIRMTLDQLSSALTVREADSPRSLSKEDSSTLLVLMEKAARRWPGQELEDSIAEYHADYERLALQYSLAKVQDALDALRIDPKQQFFPRPNEIAAKIEVQREQGVISAQRKDGEKFLTDWARHMAYLLTNPDEIAWRRERFGYDPFTDEPPKGAA